MNVDGLLPYQVDHARRLHARLTHGQNSIDFSDVGTGKMHVGAVLVRELGDRPTVVVCPKIIAPVWEETAREKGCSVTAINYEMVRTGRTTLGTWRKAANGRTYFNWNRDIDSLIFDEMHRAKGMDSQNAELLCGAKLCNKRTLLMSATPAVSPIDMRGAGFVLGWHNWQHFGAWMRKNGCEYLMTEGWVYNAGVPGMRKLNALMEAHGSRMRVDDLIAQGLFPQSKLIAQNYGAEKSAAAIEKLYRQMAEQIKELHERRGHDRSPDDIQTKLLRTRQEIELLKVPIMRDLAIDAIAQGKSVPIFVHFRQSLHALVSALSDYNPGWIIGGQRADERARFLDDFQHGRSRSIVSIASAGGIGIGMHDVYGNFPRESLICLDWSVTTLDQVLGRIHRAGSKSNAIQRIVLLDCPSERKVRKAIEKKGSQASALVDADLAPGSFFEVFEDNTVESVLKEEHATRVGESED